MSLFKSKHLLVFPVVTKVLKRTAASGNNSNVNIETIMAGNLKSWKEIPGPRSLPILGAILNFLPVIGSIGPITDFSIVSEIFCKKYGPIVRLESGLGTSPAIFLYDSEAIEQVLRSENSRMPERPGFPSLEFYKREYIKDEKPGGLLVSHGEPWKTFRSTVNPALLQPKIVKLYSDELDKVSSDMIKRLKSIRNEKNMITENFEIELNKWSLESIGVVALGGRIGCLNKDLPEDSPARQLIQCVRDAFEMSDKLDNRPGFWKYIPTPAFKKAMKVYDDQIRLTRIFIKKAMEEYKKRDKDAVPENKGVLEKLLEVDEDVAVVMASDMLFAGVDTTAHTMLGILYLLGAHPDKQAELRKEIMSTGRQDRRPYLKACIKESLRLLPITSANLRRSTKDYNLMGYFIPKGTNIVLAHEYMAKLESQYPRAKEFLPERWITNKDDPLHYGHAHPFSYSPFGYGVRMCIGRRIAELEIETLVARMIENFEVGWFGPPPKRKSAPLSYVIGPYNYVLKDVNTE